MQRGGVMEGLYWASLPPDNFLQLLLLPPVPSSVEASSVPSLEPTCYDVTWRMTGWGQ